MRVREPAVAGRFYPASRQECRSDLTRLLVAEPADCGPPLLGAPLLGGIVPHAGWMCSGKVAAEVWQRLAAATTPRVVVVFGGVHRYRGRDAALFASGRWETPLGPLEIDARLAERILGHTNAIVDDPYAHETEHSIEVQMPLVAHLFDGVTIIPIMVPPNDRAHEVGEAIGRTLKAYQYDAIIVGTTDLTHYGPSYGFTPHGVSAEANTWAKEHNDRRFIERVCAMRKDEVVGEAKAYGNACSSGAVAATLGALSMLGATKGTLLSQTCSSEVLSTTIPGEQVDSVGYAGIVFS